MDDAMEKIGKILSDEESMKQLTELAQILMNENNKQDNNLITNNNAVSDNLPDMAKIMKLTEIMGSVSQNDSNTALLLALKPHLKEERQQRVDKAVKMLKLLSVWNVARESGLLNDII